MDERIIGRIERAAGVPGLVGVLADRLSVTDLQSLLLAVAARRVAALTPPGVLRRYEADRFSGPAAVDPGAQAALDAELFAILAARGFTGVELSPVAPLGTVGAVGTVDMDKVVATYRGGEVVADSTNCLALESAVRRRALLRSNPKDHSWVRLAASHRLLRAQRFANPRLRAHFRLLALTTAGRDTGSAEFETAALLDQLDALLRILAPHHPGRIRVAFTDLTGGARRDTWHDKVMAPLRDRHPGVVTEFWDDRAAGREYYVDACFKLYADTDTDAGEAELGDGGFTTWTRDRLGNAKERLLTGCLATERLLGLGRPS